MAQYFETGVVPETAAGAIATHLRVKTPGAVAAAGALVLGASLAFASGGHVSDPGTADTHAADTAAHAQPIQAATVHDVIVNAYYVSRDATGSMRAHSARARS